MSATDLLQGQEARRRFADWLQAAAGLAVPDPEAIHVERPSGGWSNETAILSAGDVRLVLRLEPSGLAMFPSYDLGREAAVLAALNRDGPPPAPPPVPVLLGHEPDPEVLGRPFLAMAFVPGQVPSDSKPGYAEAGWLAEAPPDRQRLFWRELMAGLAALHAVDWQARGLGRLAPDGGGALAAGLDWLEGLHGWSAVAQPQVEAGLAELRRTLPAAVAAAGPDRLLWGDARPANVIARDFRVAALLDWEMAAIGPAELDLAWLLEMHWMRTEGAGVVPPAGFPDEAGLLALYAAAAGGQARRPSSWYRLFSAVKMAVLMHRHLVVAVDRGMLRAGHPLLRENVATRRVGALLEQDQRKQDQRKQELG